MNAPRRVTISGNLIAQTPLSVGGLDADVSVDLPLARNACGELFIPGTSLAGAIRSRFNPDKPELWGDSENTGASKITIHDAVVQQTTEPEHRTRVSIDRFSGTAAEGMLFDLEVLPVGTSFEFSSTILETETCWTCGLKEFLEAGFHIGRGKSTGLGLVKLADPKIEQLVFDEDGMKALLSPVKNAQEFQCEAADHPSASGGEEILTITIEWRPLGPLLSHVANDETDAKAKSIPRTVACSGCDSTKEGEHVHLLLPGSSIKGSLRAQAAKIMRTIQPESEPADAAAEEAPLQVPADKTQLHRLKEEASLQVPAKSGSGQAGDVAGQSAGVQGGSVESTFGPIGLLFGASSEGRKRAGGHQGAIRVKDCRSKKTISKEKLYSLTGASADANTARDSGFVLTTRVAIDRWTGGALDGALWTSLDPYFTSTENKKAWEPITIEIDCDRLGEFKDQCLTLLHLVLKDLEDGWFGLGFGQTRGYGAIQVKSVKWKGRPTGGFHV